MFFHNTAPSVREFTLLRGRTPNGRAKAVRVTVPPRGEADFSADDLRKIAERRADAAIFERDFQPGRALNSSGVVAPSEVRVSEKMRQLIAQASAGEALDDGEALERSDREYRAALEAETARRELDVRSGRIELGSRIITPSGSRLTAKEAADLAARTDEPNDAAREASRPRVAIDPDSIPVADAAAEKPAKKGR